VVDVAPEAVPGHGVNVARVFATTESPPPARRPALGEHVDTSLLPGTLRWMVVEHPPHHLLEGRTTSTTMHHSDALDLVFVHEGSGQLLLQDGPHDVTVGDLIVMPGVDHAMRAGPDGCRLVVVSVGTPPPG
jgi:quercetin dioxygenase-like cupin family protein